MGQLGSFTSTVKRSNASTARRAAPKSAASAPRGRSISVALAVSPTGDGAAAASWLSDPEARPAELPPRVSDPIRSRPDATLAAVRVFRWRRLALCFARLVLQVRNSPSNSLTACSEWQRWQKRVTEPSSINTCGATWCSKHILQEQARRTGECQNTQHSDALRIAARTVYVDNMR